MTHSASVMSERGFVQLPTAGLSRGILLFDSVDQPLTDINTAIERLSVGVQPMPWINASRHVAFALPAAVTLLYFDPPGVLSDPPAVTIQLEPGVCRSTPTPWGEPNVFEQVANTDGPYASFGRVRTNDSGLVVFEALPDDGGFGIFTGSDPITSKVVAVGDTLGDLRFSFVRLGELNNADQIACSLPTSTLPIASSSASTTCAWNLPSPPHKHRTTSRRTTSRRIANYHGTKRRGTSCMQSGGSLGLTSPAAFSRIPWHAACRFCAGILGANHGLNT